MTADPVTADPVTADHYPAQFPGSPAGQFLTGLRRSLADGTFGQPLPPDTGDEAPPPPSPSPRCPDCSGPLGDGDRVLYGRCGRCAGCYPELPPVARAARRCWCGRRVSTLPDGNGFECSEHDDPLPATGPSTPSTPLTPGGVLDRRFP